MPAAVETSLTPGSIFRKDFRPGGVSQGHTGRPLRILQVLAAVSTPCWLERYNKMRVPLVKTDLPGPAAAFIAASLPAVEHREGLQAQWDYSSAEVSRCRRHSVARDRHRLRAQQWR